jgi:hypothetical protein
VSGPRGKRWTAVAGGLGLLVALGARPALAQAPSTEARVTEARKACLTGDYQRGAALLAELFADTGDATYIYNQARCYQQNSRPTEAINHFREYLRVAKNLPADVITETEGHIREMEKDKAASAPTTVAPPPVAVPPPAPTPAPPRSGPIVIGSPGDSAGGGSERGRTQKLAGIIVASVGGAAVIGGIVFGLKTKSLQDDVEKNYDRGTYDSGKSAATLQWVFYGIGGAAIATGAVLYGLGWRAGNGETSSVSFLPVLDPRAPGGAVRMIF